MIQSAQCKICNVTTKTVDVSTSEMYTHLPKKHYLSTWNDQRLMRPQHPQLMVHACRPSSTSSSSLKVNKYVIIYKFVKDANKKSVSLY